MIRIAAIRRGIVHAIVMLALFLTACTPEKMAALLDGNDKGDWSMSGACDFEKAGYEISYDESKDKTVFLFWVSGGECDYE